MLKRRGIAWICLEYEQKVGHIGMFVVHPLKQASDIGKHLLAEAEKLAQRIWVAKHFQMHVITIWHALIAFYERRGYIRTGILVDFPVKSALWQPKLAGLKLETLKKLI